MTLRDSDADLLSAWTATEGRPIGERLKALREQICDECDESASEQRNDAWVAGFESGKEST